MLSFVPTGGVQAPGYSMLLFLVVLAGVLLGWRVALAVTFINGAIGVVFLWADSQGILPYSPLPDDNFRVWFFYGVTALITMMLLKVGLDSVREALARAQHELHQRHLSEERFAKIFRASPYAQLISELESGIILDVNESFQRVTGFSREMAIGSTATMLNVYGENAGRLVWFNPLNEQGFVHDLEIPMRHQNGEVRTCSVSIERIELDGKACVITFVQDITSRKQAELAILQARDELREREAQLRTILNNLPFWVWLKDVNGRFLMVNNLVIEDNPDLSSKDQFIGKTDSEISPPELANKYRSDDLQVMETLSPLFKEELVLVNGETKLFETYKAPYLGDENQLLGTFGFSRDITERKQAEQTLLESEARFRSVFEDAGIGMVLVNQNHAIVKLNRAFANMVGYLEEELTGKLFKEITHPDDVGVSVDQYGSLFKGKVSGYGLEKRYLHKQGSIVWAMLHVSLVRPVGGQPTYAIAQVQDITDRKQAEADRELLIQELGRRNAELERFAYTVSHDLKSPLVTIGGFLGFLERDAESGDFAQLRSDIGSIRDAAGKMRLLLDELLELSRIGRLMNAPEEISFAVIVQDALLVTQGHLVGCEVVVTDADFPTVIGDRIRLVEVVQNLIDNAAKFMGEQSQPRITIGVRQDEATAVFFVQDNGIGILPKYQDKIFDIFNKLNPDVEGTGIGLALVKRIVEVHNGRLWVESDGLGQGSTFCFTLNEMALSSA